MFAFVVLDLVFQ